MAMVSDRRCPACGQPNPPGSLVCGSCFEPLGVSGPIERRVEQSPHLRIFVQSGSFADQQSSAVAQRLEALIDAAAATLAVPAPDGQISVYLGEVLQDPAQPGKALTAGSYIVAAQREVWSVYRSDAPGIDLERTFVRLLLSMHTGSDPARAPFLLDGLVGVFGQIMGLVPPPEQLSLMLAGAKASGMPLEIAPLFAGPSEANAQIYDAASTSFVGWLISDRGPEGFLKLLSDYDPQQPAATAKAAYGQTFEALEKRWQQALRKSAPSVGGIGRFLRTSLVYLRPYRGKQIEIIVYILFGIVFSQLLPHAQRYLIDNALTTKKDTSLLVKMLVAGLILFFVMGLASLRETYLSAEIGEGVLRDMRRQMFAKLQDLSAGYYSKTGTGDILSRMSNDLFAVEFALTGALLQGLVLVLTFLASLASLLYLDWKLTVIALVALPFFYLITRFLGPPASRASRDRQERLSDVTTVLQENVTAQPVIRAYGLKRSFLREWMDQTAGLYKSAIRLTFLGSLFGLSASLLTTLIQVLAFGVGGYYVIQGQLSLGALVAFLSLLGGLIAPAQSLSGVAQSLQQASGAMDRVTELLNAEPAVADRPDSREMGPLRQGITFENVTFSYTGGEPQLEDVSFTIPAGASVAFVGPSGSGKSTVTNLILRFYDADRGSVRMDGADARDLSIDSLRGQMGLVFQENFLFNRSVRENIRFGREDATDQEVDAAARAAEVHEFITNMPQGYDTVVGERGSNLSGGQRQRLSIARAILRNPSVLVLDEATSALDPRTENAINHTLASLARGRTTISVTHRLAAAATADRIYVLDRGRLMEEGTHAELLTSGGLYARLYEEQSGGTTDGVLRMALEIEYLRRVPIFARLNGDQLSRLASRLTTERFEVGSNIVRAGEAGDKLYLVVSGEAEVLTQDSGATGRILVVLRSGDYFGEIALMYDVPRTATVRARTSVTAYALDQQDFRTLLQSIPGMRQTIEQAAADREASHAIGPTTPGVTSASTDEAGAAFHTAGARLAEPDLTGRSDASAAMVAAPWTRRRARLLVLEGENAGRAYTLNDEFTGIGRHPSNDIVMADRRVSGFHARIDRGSSGSYTVTDSGSSNGTTLDGELLTEPAELADGAKLALGQTILRFEKGA